MQFYADKVIDRSQLHMRHMQSAGNKLHVNELSKERVAIGHRLIIWACRDMQECMRKGITQHRK